MALYRLWTLIFYKKFSFGDKIFRYQKTKQKETYIFATLLKSWRWSWLKEVQLQNLITFNELLWVCRFERNKEEE